MTGDAFWRRVMNLPTPIPAKVEPAKAYIVTGSTGEYDACRTWPVCVHLSKQAAEQHAARAEARADQIVDEWNAKYEGKRSIWDLEYEIEDGDHPGNEHDPDMRIDSNGVKYWVTSCDFAQGKE